MIASDGENIFDLCINATGSINNMNEFLLVNNFSIDYTVNSGVEYVSLQSIKAKDEFIVTTNYKKINDNYYLVYDNQNLFDITCMYYGDISYLFTVLNDNGLSVSDRLESGMKILINNNNLGNEAIKKNVIKNNIVFCNNQSSNVSDILLGSYNDSYNNSYSK